MGQAPRANSFRHAPFPNAYQARKRHININFLVRLLLGHPGNVPGTNPGDKVGLSQGQTWFSPYFTQWKPGMSLGQTQFVPGTFRGRRVAERVYVLKVYVPFSFPSLERFGKAFHLEVPRGIPFLFRRQKGTYLGTQCTYHQKNSFSETPFPNTRKMFTDDFFGIK